MKKLFAGLAIVIVLGIGGWFIFGNSSTQNETSNNAETTATETQKTSELTSSQSAGQYTEFSEQAFSSANGDRLLFFHAPWCPQCRALDEDIKAKGIPEGVTIFKVDYDSNQDLRKKYGVTIQTTVVKVDKDGKEVKKFVAYDEPTVDSLKSNIF